jgi:hypothetical protein
MDPQEFPSEAVTPAGDKKKTGKINAIRNFRCFASRECQYLFEMSMIFLVVITSIYNLSTQNGDQNLWTALLFGAFGGSMPSPRQRSERDKIIDDKI